MTEKLYRIKPLEWREDNGRYESGIRGFRVLEPRPGQFSAIVNNQHAAVRTTLNEAKTFIEEELKKLLESSLEELPPQPDLQELTDWKASQLAVESQWNPQAIAKLLDIPLGADIRSNIEPKIRELLKQNDGLREYINDEKNDVGTLQEKLAASESKLAELENKLSESYEILKAIAYPRCGTDEYHGTLQDFAEIIQRNFPLVELEALHS